MLTRRFAQTLGVIFLLVGIMGFIPALLTNPNAHVHGDHGVVVHSFDGYLLGLFHVNAIHSGVHILFGFLGLWMGAKWETARLYARIVAVSYALLAILGLISAFNLDTVFGLIPIHGHDVWLHAGIAAVAAYFGFAAPAETRLGGTPPVVPSH